ncbi:LOW QUALITY PROTEIN: myosin-6-like [Haliotis rubra]|uniref:LOW QUALITY PROTEIN: myosin-6-like n=1 Tax=Haliotis rubra TaxID=36100 RepID=UPI001EE51AA6|nr:LOW QUALITY PROTEIN: myosin-6-like [Haliotis rubra]
MTMSAADVMPPRFSPHHGTVAGDLAVCGSPATRHMHSNNTYSSATNTRPRSTPASSRAHSSGGGRMNRPKTAAAVLSRTDCDRVLQVEQEPTRRHNFENHLPTKRSKPPPWQKNMEAPLVPFVVGPGYILSRSKSKFAVTLKDEFFTPPQDENQKKRQGDNERDTLIAQLHQQISDLTLYLDHSPTCCTTHTHKADQTQGNLPHAALLTHTKQTKHRAEEFMRDKMDELHNQHQDYVRDLEEQNQAQMEHQKQQLEAEAGQFREAAESQITRMTKEIEFLQGAFESYKSTLHRELDDKWRMKEDELRHKYEEDKQTMMHDMKTKMIHEKNVDRVAMMKDAHKQIEVLRKEHKKELDALVRRFSNAAADIERLKKTMAELEETKADLEQVTTRYNETCQQLTSTTRLLTDTKVRLLEYEEQFQDKVQAVDDKYRQQLQELMRQNTELRRQYNKKCGELFDEKAMSEKENYQRVQSAKETMRTLIKVKERSKVNISAADPTLEQLGRVPKVRPGSAPITRQESKSAHLSAGETDHLHKPKEFVRPETVVPQEDPELEKIREKLFSEEVRVFTKEEIISALDS